MNSNYMSTSRISSSSSRSRSRTRSRTTRPRSRSRTRKPSSSRTYRAPLRTQGRTVGKRPRTKRKIYGALNCKNWFRKSKIDQYNCLMNDEGLLRYLENDYLSSDHYFNNKDAINDFLLQFESMFKKESLEKKARLRLFLTRLQEETVPASYKWLPIAINASNRLRANK